jgi:UDP-N-acetylglucosamine enolpyruvyl transferase
MPIWVVKLFQSKTISASALLSPTICISGAKEWTVKLLPIVVVMTSTKENIEKVKVLQDIKIIQHYLQTCTIDYLAFTKTIALYSP